LPVVSLFNVDVCTRLLYGHLHRYVGNRGENLPAAGFTDCHVRVRVEGLP